MSNIAHRWSLSLARWVAVVLVAVIATLGASRASAQVVPIPNKLYGVEKWMREYQARMIVYIILYGKYDEDRVNPVIWPSAYDGTPAPYYPYDGFYDESFRHDPNFGYYLTRAMTLAFVGGENPMWTDEYGVPYYGYRLWNYYMRDTEPTTGTGTFDLAEHDRLPTVTSHDGTTDPSTKFFLHGEDFVTPESIVPTGDPRTPEHISVTVDNYGLVFEFLKAAIRRLNRIDMPMGYECPADTSTYIRGYSQTFDNYLVGDGSALGTCYAAAQGPALTGWASSAWDDCSQNGGGNLTGVAIGPPTALEVTEVNRENDYINAGDIRWDVRAKALRRAGYLTFDFHNLHSKYQAYVAVEPGADGGAYAAGVEVDRKYHLIGEGEGRAKFRSDLIGYDNTNAPLSAVNDVPGGPTCTVGSCQSVFRVRGWRIWNEDYLAPWAFDSGNAAVVVFTPDFEVIARTGMGTGQCANCGSGAVPSAPRAEGTTNGGIVGASVGWSLGRASTGAFSGSLMMQTHDLSAASIQPLALITEVRGATQVGIGSVPSSGNGKPLTLTTGTAVIVAEDTTTTSGTDPHAETTISLYNLPTISSSSVAYQTTVLALREEQTVTNPAAPTTTTMGTTLTVTTTGQCPSKTQFTQVGDNWEIATGFDGTNYLRRERIVREENSTTGVVTLTHSVVGPDNIVVTVSTESTKAFAWGTEVVARSSGETGSGMGVHGETYTYHENATLTGGGDNPSYTRLKSVTTTEGAWRYYEYDSTGAVVKDIAQYKGSAYGTNVTTLLAEGHARLTTITSGNPTGNGSVIAQIGQTVETIAGVAVSRTCTMAFPEAQGKYAGTGEVEAWTIRCASPDAPSNVVTSLATTYANPWTVADQVEILVSESDGLRRPLRRMTYNGSLSVYTYSYSITSPNYPRTTYVENGPSNSSRTAVRGGTKTTTVVNAQGVVTSSKTEEFDPSSTLVTVSETTATTIDAYGRVTSWHHLDGTDTAADYDCCGKDFTTDALGVKTWYQYDALKRETSSARQVGPTVSTVTPVITTLTTYDADGRVLTESRKGTDDTTMLLSSNYYDRGGRMTSSANALGETTSYTETVYGGFVTSTETMPDPDGTGTLSAPISVRVAYPDGMPVSVNVPFTAATSASAPQQFASGTTTLGGATVRTSTRYASDSTTLSTAYPRTISYSNALGQTIKTTSSLASGTWAEQTMSYDPATHIRTQIDPDGVRSFSVSGYGAADAATYLGYTVPTALEPYFKCRWSLTALDVNGDGAISFAGTSGGPGDRITLTSSWLATRAVGSSTVPVQHSATIVWNNDSSSSSVIETFSSDSTLDGLKSWSQSFQEYSSSETVNDTSSTSTHFGRTVTTTDPSGGTTESREEFGRQIYSKRTHAGSVFGGKTVFEYDAHGRVSKSHMLHTASATWNGTDDDVTETTYDEADRVLTTTAPSPNGGTGSGSGTRHVSTYTYDRLGRVVQVELPGSKNTKTSYTAQGQVETVRGFGVNPADYGYDTLGRMTTLSTYQDLQGAPTTSKATTTWNYDPYSGRLLNKKYQGTGSGSTDIAYAYKDSGRPLTRITRRGITTTYAYDSHTGEPISTIYSDSTPAVLFTKRDRLGRVTEMADAAGKHTMAYLIDGRVLSETIASDTGITGAPHANYLSGVTLTNSYEMMFTSSGTIPDGTPRYATEVTMGSTILNHVDFVYDSEDRITELTKSYGRVAYEYDPITGRVTTSISKVSNGGSTYYSRLRGSRSFDRLGRMSGIGWKNVPSGSSTASTSFVTRGYASDVHGRRTVMTAGMDEQSEDWAYGYDDKNQLTSAQATFSYSSPAVAVPGLQFGYTYDDIGNRTQTVQGDALTGSSSYSATYTPNALNQYDSRTVPGKIEVTGYADPGSDVYVNSTTTPAYRYLADEGFFHERLTVNNSAGPERTVVNIQDAPPMGAAASYDVYVPAATEAFTYDADGNLASDGIWNYNWDAENRLIHMVMNPDIIGVMVGQSQAWLALTFRYDGMGRRILKELGNSTDYDTHIQKGDLSSAEFSTSYYKKYVYDIGSWNLSTVLRQSGSTFAADQTFAWGPDLSGSENGAGGIGGLAIYVDDYNDGGVGATIGPMFPVYDGNGNILRLYDGHIDTSEMPDHKLAEYRYGPFGEGRGQTGPQAARFPFRWSTKFTDNETGLVYYGYRYYSPSMGRWISRDPLLESGHVNVQNYVGNTPQDTYDMVGLIGHRHPACGLCNPSIGQALMSREGWSNQALDIAGMSAAEFATLGSNRGISRGVFAWEHRQASKFYDFYATSYALDTRLLWSGAAAVGGKLVIEGLDDVGMKLLTGRGLESMAPETAAWSRHQIMKMGKLVFADLGWQHAIVDQLGLQRGLYELRRHIESGDISEDVFYKGWCTIYDGHLFDGNSQLLYYEQRFILQHPWEEFSALTPWVVDPTFPGTQSFQSWITLHWNEFDRGPFRGDVRKFDQRWAWMSRVVMPRWAYGSEEWRNEMVLDSVIGRMYNPFLE